MTEKDQEDLFDANIAGDDGDGEDQTGLTASADVKPAPKKAAAKPAAKKATTTSPAKKPRTKIVLEENDNIPPSGLFIGHNGKGYLLKPGEEASVPDEVLNILKDAIISVPVVDPRTSQVVGYRNRMRYPYRNV